MIGIFQNYSFWKQANLARSMEMNDGEREHLTQKLMFRGHGFNGIHPWDLARSSDSKVLSRIGSGEVDVSHSLTDASLVEVKFWRYPSIVIVAFSRMGEPQNLSCRPPNQGSVSRTSIFNASRRMLKLNIFLFAHPISSLSPSCPHSVMSVLLVLSKRRSKTCLASVSFRVRRSMIIDASSTHLGNTTVCVRQRGLACSVTLWMRNPLNLWLENVANQFT